CRLCDAFVELAAVDRGRVAFAERVARHRRRARARAAAADVAGSAAAAGLRRGAGSAGADRAGGSAVVVRRDRPAVFAEARAERGVALGGARSADVGGFAAA